MATRFSPTFDITTGLLSNQDMTPEEEAAWLAEQERLYGVPIDTNPMPEEDEEEDYLPPEEELPPEDEVQFEDEPLVVEDEPLAVATDVPDLSNDPLAPLPEGVQEAPRPKQEAVKKELAKKKEPLVVEDEPEAPLVVDEDVDRTDPWVSEHKAQAAAIRKARDANSTNVKLPSERNAYENHVTRLANKMLREGKSAEEISAAALRLADEIYGHREWGGWDASAAKADYDERRKKGMHIPEYQVQSAGEKTDEEPTPEGQPTFVQSIKKGAAQSVELTERAKQAVLEIVGADQAADAAGRKAQWAKHLREGMPQGTRVFDINSLASAVQWASQVVGEQGVLMAAPIGGATLGRVVGGSLGAKVGAFGPSWALGTGEIQAQNKEISPEQKAGLATIAGGGVIGVLDSALPGRVGTRLVDAFGMDAAQVIARRMLLAPASDTTVAMLKRIGAQGLKDAGIEGGTEFSQSIIGNIASALETNTDLPPDMLSQAIEEGLTGAFMGKVIGTTTGAIEEVAGRQPPEARPLVVDAEQRGPAVVVRTTRTPVNAEGREEQFQIPNGRITSKFGPRQTFRTANGQMASSNHAGIDVALPAGAPAPAGASGVVVKAGKNGGYGNQVIIKHSDGTTSSYSHLSKIGVQVGDQVAQGESVGKVGKTGNATGPHLHIERRDRQGRAVNPLTGGRVVTVRDETTGEWTDNTDWQADQREVDNFWQDAADQEELENAYEDATGQRMRRERREEEIPAPEAASPDAPASVAIARGDNVTAAIVEPEPPAPARGVSKVEEAVRAAVTGPGAKDIAAAATADLDAAKARNPAKAALVAINTPERDWSLAQEGEEPVFAEAVEGSEVVGFTDPTIGAFRAIGEPATMPVAQPGPTAPNAPAEPTPTDILTPTTEADVQPVATEGLVEEPSGVPADLPVESAPEPQPLAATTEELELERKQRLLDALPAPPSSQPFEVREARVAGQAVGLGLQSAPPLSSMSKAEKTAFNLGRTEGAKALENQDFVADTSRGSTATTPQVATSSTPTQKISRGRPSNESKRIAEIDRKADKYEEKLFDLETDGNKTGARVFIQRLIRDGVLPADAMQGYAYMFKDRDMGVDDITSELRTDIQMWADEQKAGKGAPKEETKAAPKKAKPAPKKKIKRKAEEDEQPKLTDSFSERARFRPPAKTEGRLEQHDRPAGVVSEGRDEGASRSRGEPVGQTPPVDADGNVELDHFTLEENLTKTDPSQWGRSSKFLPPEERMRIGKAPGRTYFGIGTGRPGGYVNEYPGGVHPRFRSPVARVQAKVPLAKLYDMNGDPDNLKAKGRAMPKNDRGQYIYKGKPVDGVSLYELLIKDAGYSGYWIKNESIGMVAAVFDPVAVKPYTAPAPVKKSVAAKATVKRQTTINEVITDQMVKDIVGVLRQMQVDGHPDLTVELVDSIEGSQGTYNPNERLIQIAAMAKGKRAKTADITKHEIIHWMRDTKVINAEEWRALREWAEKNPALMNWAQAHYGGEGLTRDELIEEAVAEGFARWQGGDIQKISAADTKVQAIFEKMLRVLAAIRNAISGAGVTRGQISKAQAIFEDLASGQQAKKAAARGTKGKPSVTFGKKRTAWQEGLSREMLNGNISVEQRVFLEQNPSAGVKFQSAYHGTAKEDIDQFKLDFIGTGEGAQAFGWGLYFAERQDVADWYRKKIVLGGRRDPVDQIVTKDGVAFRDLFPNTSFDAGAVYEVADRIMNFLATHPPYNGWLEAIHVEFDKDIDTWVRQAEKDKGQGSQTDAELDNEISLLKESQKNVNDVFRALKAGDKGASSTIKVKEVVGGKLYKVEVPENEELFDLDKRLEDQHPIAWKATQQIVATLDRNGMLEAFEDRFGDYADWTGLEFTRIIMPNAIYQGVEPDGEISTELDTALTNGHAPMATSIWLRDLGVKGARYFDRDSRSGEEGKRTANFVIFDDSAIQLKTKQKVISTPISSPLSDPTNPNPGIFRRIHDQTMGLLGAIAGKDVDAADNMVDAFRRKVTQRYQQVIKTQNRSAAMLGVDRLPAGQNPMEMITADERGYKLQFLTDNMVRPMAKELAARGLSMDDLGLFLYARHAPARNARIAAINPEFRSPANPGSGMTDAEAAQIMADFAADGKMSDLMSVATHIDAMIAYAQAERLSSGLISAKDVAAGFGPSDFYVPLRGNENIEPELEMDFTLAARKGGGFSVSGKEGHRMFGRASKADLEEIVGYTITQAQEAIDRGYRNRVAQAMLNMFRNTPDPDFVKIDRVKRVAVWNKKKGAVEYQMQTRITDPKEQQRTIYVKEDGSVTKMTFQEGNPSAMRFVAAAKNLGMSELPRFLQLMSAFTRVWTKSNTQWNPDFILANATKDVQTGMLNAKTLDQKGLRRKMLKNLISLGPLRGAFFGSMHGAGAGFSSANPWSQTFAEFEANGGKLNYGQIEPLEDAIKSARREMRNAKRSVVHPIKVATEVGNFIDHLNSAFENMTRLAAYKALRDLGIPAKQAAESARELTTNFQQHGEWGPKVNAAYGFANASIIGGARFAKTIAKSPAIAVGLISFGMMVDFLNSLYDEDEWDEYTEEDKHANFIILLPDDLGFDIKIPAGYGINSFTTAGRKMSELWRGKHKKDGTKMSVLDAAADTAMGFINSFSPITGQSFWNIVTPTIGDPVVNIYRNENNWGRPIMPPAPFRKEQQKPDSQLAFDNTHQFWKSLATTMNVVGGGNEVVPGFTPLDMSPETYKHVTQETVGGAGRTFMRTIQLIEKAATGKDVGLNDVPILRRFAGNPYGAATAKEEQIGAFYDRLNQGRVAIAQAKEMMARYGKDSEEYQEYRKENEPLINFAETIEAADKRLRAYNTAENAAERGATRAKGLKRRDRKAIFKVTRVVVPANRPLTDEEVAKIKAKVKDKKERLAARFNELYMADVMKEAE